MEWAKVHSRAKRFYQRGLPSVDIILASTSTTRKTVLANAGVAFTSHDPKVDETAAKRAMQDNSPRAVAISLAGAKSKAVSQHFPQSLVIGADQTLGLNNAIFDKPRSVDEARSQLRLLRNQTHSLYSALCCCRAGETLWTCCEEARLTMRDFSDVFLERYLADIAETYALSVGGYRLEEKGINLFTQIQGDYFTILGLPLLPLLAFLRRETYLPS